MTADAPRVAAATPVAAACPAAALLRGWGLLAAGSLAVAGAMALLLAAMPVWRAATDAATGYAVDPAGFERQVEAMVAAHATGEAVEGVPVVRPPPGDVYLSARRFAFYPALELRAGETYRLHVASADILHGLHGPGIDRLMRRTARRPLVTGEAAPHTALWLAGVLPALGLALAAVGFNLVVVLHLFLGAFVYGVVYTVWLKRRTWLNIVIGGAAGSFAVLAGAAAVDPGQWLLPTLLAIVLFLWTPTHFWALAILLKDDYCQAGVLMLPVLVGKARTARAILVNSLLLVGASLLPWALGALGPAYGFGAALLGAGLLWFNLRLLRAPTREWARRNFLASMPYLMGLFVAVLVDRAVF